MVSEPIRQDGQPEAADTRAQVQRMIASNVFSGSPQLSAFLLFIVEAVLRGKGDRLKGYTIGVEVLRRDTSFDPRLDPIVRVEATRLRRAIARYYADPGIYDAVIIELQRGSYAPRISWRDAAAAAPIAETQLVLSPGNGMPTLRIAPFVVVGTPGELAIDGETLRSKLSEAFALFDSINVIAATPPVAGGRYDYRLDGTVEYRGDGSVCLRFKLVDKADETVIWSRAFDKLPAGESAAEIEHKVILELATNVAHSFGIIWSHERARQLATDKGDPRYRALIQAGDAFRSFEPASYARARDTLERLIAIDTGFAAGFSYLAVIHLVEYLHGFGVRPDPAPPLDRALKMARRGVEFKPQSAFAYHILFIVLFTRGETEAARATAEKAVTLNPYDIQLLSDFGGRLIFAGDLDKGMEILGATAALGIILPAWTHFYLFLGHYLRGEMSEARFHAGQMTSETHAFGQLARALMAHHDGHAEDARRAVQTILSIRPEWRADARREIGKMIIAPAIADRLAADLMATGYLTSPI